MALKLTLTGGAIGRATRTLSTGTLSIGRGENNDWVLPDPDRTLSKAHCVISVENGRYVLTDLSTNGVFINGARTQTERDSRTVLTDGDDFRLGQYTVTLAEESDNSSAVWDDGPPRGNAEAHDPLAIDPLEDPLGRPPDPAFSHPVRHAPAPLRAADPFDRQDEESHRPVVPDQDNFAGKTPQHEWRGPSQPDHADAPRLAMQMPRVAPPAARAADIDFDKLIGDLSPFQPQAPAPRPAPVAPAAPPRPAAADPFPGLDDLFAPAAVPQPPPAAPVPPPRPADTVPPAPLPTPVPAPVAASVAASVAAPVHEPERPAPPPVTAATPRITPDAALRAFLDGAGVPNAAVGADPEATLHAVGQVFRALTEGIREVLMSRAALKGEMRVEQTLLRASNNNALKFSFSPEEAVIALLNSNRPGYMAPLDAAKEALHDIKMHEIAVVAGMQTALHALLDRFDPQALETRLAQGKLAALLPNARKAGLWDRFTDLHATVKSEAEDDFQAAFGRAFAKAYTAQSKKD